MGSVVVSGARILVTPAGLSASRFTGHAVPGLPSKRLDRIASEAARGAWCRNAKRFGGVGGKRGSSAFGPREDADHRVEPLPQLCMQRRLGPSDAPVERKVRLWSRQQVFQRSEGPDRHPGLARVGAKAVECPVTPRRVDFTLASVSFVLFDSPWDFSLRDTREDMQLIVHMWIGFFYSRSTARFIDLGSDRDTNPRSADCIHPEAAVATEARAWLQADRFEWQSQRSLSNTSDLNGTSSLDRDSDVLNSSPGASNRFEVLPSDPQVHCAKASDRASSPTELKEQQTFQVGPPCHLHITK